MPHLLATALTGAAFALLTTVPSPAGADAAGAALRLTVRHPQGDGPARSVTLVCHPTGGTHPEADRACAQLTRSGGRIESAPRPGTVCTMIYAPVRAEADGHWHGRRIRFRAQYSNPCTMAARTGVIFRF